MAKAVKAMWLEQSESQRLESLAGSVGLLALVQTTRLTGGYDSPWASDIASQCYSAIAEWYSLREFGGE